MKSRAVVHAVGFSCVLLASLAVPARAVTVFGPERCVRQLGSPTTCTYSFAAITGEGVLLVVNGEENGTARLTSARVLVNGTPVAGPSDFKYAIDRLVVPVELVARNQLTVELRSTPGTFLTIWVLQDRNFEMVPAWDRPEASVVGLVVSPERAQPGQDVELVATILNSGTAPLASPDVVFVVDDEIVARGHVRPIGPGESAPYRASWIAAGAGTHLVQARLEFPDADDKSPGGRIARTAKARVAGGTTPEPDLDIIDPDLGALGLNAGESREIPVTVRNPSFAPIEGLPVTFLIDGQPLSHVDIDPDYWDAPPDVMSFDAILNLAPGDEVTLRIPWNDIAPGEHTIGLKFHLTEAFPVTVVRFINWATIIPSQPVLYAQPDVGKWSSMGPRLILGDSEPAPTGRIDRLAVNPLLTTTLYAGAPAGGLWKSTNDGLSWAPLGDRWPNLRVGAVALDPSHPDIVYVGTGSSMYKGGAGIFKSIDGGQHWRLFATTKVAEGVSRLVVRHTSPTEYVIYALTDRGLLRYRGTDCNALGTTPDEWVLMKAGLLVDLAVSPSDPDLVYVSLGKWELSAKLKATLGVGAGLFRARNGTTLVLESEWQQLSTGLPTITATDASLKSGFLKLDIFAADSKYLYAAVQNPPLGEFVPFLGFYRSADEGNTWQKLWYEYPLNGYNDFIRVHPTRHQVYWGGVKLFTRSVDLYAPWQPVRRVLLVHDDMKDLVFLPNAPDYYYSLNDGGVWLCHSFAPISDQCAHRNTDLRVTQFYDIDTGDQHGLLMIGGTQDNRTIITDDGVNWRNALWDGDGSSALLSPNFTDTMWGQYQSLDSTKRSEDGGAHWVAAGSGLPNGFPTGTADIRVSRFNPSRLIAGGDQVYTTTNGGDSWIPAGPPGRTLVPSTAKFAGWVTRVRFEAWLEDCWMAGTQQGQVWWTNNAGQTWHLVFEHPARASVTGLAFAYTGTGVSYVTFNSPDPKARDVYRIERQPGNLLGWTVTRITSNLPVGNRELNTVVVSPKNAVEVFVGTDAGVYRGTLGLFGLWNWQPWNDGLPLAKVTDLEFEGTTGEVRAATFGRGAWRIKVAQ